MASEELEIKSLVERADFQAVKSITTLYERTADKCAFVSAVIRVCACCMNGHPDDSRQFKSTCLILSSWKFECSHWNLDQLITGVETIITLIEQQTVIIGSHLLKLLDSMLVRISSHKEIRLANGQITSGSELFVCALVQLLKSNWHPQSSLQIIIFFKEILPLGPNLNKLFFEKVFAVPIPANFHSAVIYHLIIILHRCNNAQLYSIFLQNLQFFAKMPDVFESAVTAINQTSRKAIIDDNACKMLRNFTDHSPLLFLLCLCIDQETECQKVVKARVEYIKKYARLISGQNAKLLYEKLQEFLLSVSSYISKYDEETMDSFSCFLCSIQYQPLVGIIGTIMGHLSSASPMSFPLWKMYDLKDLSKLKLGLLLNSLEDVKRLDFDLVLRLFEAHPLFFAKDYDHLVYAGNCGRRLLESEQCVVEAFIGAINILDVVNDPNHYFISVQLLLHLLALNPFIPRVMLHPYLKNINPKVISHAIYLRINQLFPEYGFVCWEKLIPACVQTTFTGNEQSVIKLGQIKWYLPLGMLMISLIQSLSGRPDKEESKTFIDIFTKRLNDLVKKLTDPNFEIVTGNITKDPVAFPLGISVALDLCGAGILWAVNGQLPKNMLTKNVVKSLLKRMQWLYESSPSGDDVRLPLIMDSSTLSYLLDEEYCTSYYIVQLIVRNCIEFRAFSSPILLALSKKLCERFPCGENFTIIQKMDSFDGDWILQELEKLLKNLSPKENNILPLLDTLLENGISLGKDISHLISKNIFGSNASTKRIFERLIELDFINQNERKLCHSLVKDAGLILGKVDENLPTESLTVGINLKSVSSANVNELIHLMLKLILRKLQDFVWIIGQKEDLGKAHWSLIDYFSQVLADLSVCTFDLTCYDCIQPVLLAFFQIFLKVGVSNWTIEIVKKNNRLIDAINLMIPAQQQLEQNALSELPHNNGDSKSKFFHPTCDEKENVKFQKSDRSKKRSKSAQCSENSEKSLITKMERESERIPRLVQLMEEYLLKVRHSNEFASYANESVVRGIKLDQQELKRFFEEQALQFDEQEEIDEKIKELQSAIEILPADISVDDLPNPDEIIEFGDSNASDEK